MVPVLFRIGSFEIYSFGVMLALAVLLGFFWFARRVQNAGGDVDAASRIFLGSIIAALVGARLLYWVFFPQSVLEDPLGSLFNRGGLVWYGGVAGFTLVTFLLCRREKMAFTTFGDWIAPPVALALALGRIGCLLAGCCYGAVCRVEDIPWAIRYPMGHETYPYFVHPSPLYESLLALALMGFLLWVERRQKVSGQVTGWFLFGYGMIRFGLEYLRGDRVIWLPGLDLSASQIISLGMIVAGGLLLFSASRSRQWLGE